MSERSEQWLAEDAAARLAALDVSRSIILQAPAGSGKTTVLVCRLLELLSTVDAPECILAITFTRKASAEMRERVMRALREAATGSGQQRVEAPAAARALAWSRQQGWDLLNTPARLRIQTIDATNQRLAALCPVTSGGGGASLAIQPQWLYDAAARRCLQLALHDGALHADVQQWLQRLDNNWMRLADMIAAMLKRRSYWLPMIIGQDDEALLQGVTASIRRIIGHALRDLLAAMPAGLLQETRAVTDVAARNLIAAGKADPHGAQGWLATAGALRAEPEELARWRLVQCLLLRHDGQWRRSLNALQGVPTTDAAFKQRALQWLADVSAEQRLLPLWQEIGVLPDPGFAADDRAALLSLSRLLVRAVAELNLEFADTGNADFIQLAGAARQALVTDGRPSDLALRNGEVLRHILVDEFQDTSTEQVELLNALTASWTPGDGRSLFLVGDPLQSIYLFRDAEVGLFLRAQHDGLRTVPLQPLALRCNFRSAPSLVQWVNERFVRLFPGVNDARLGAIRYLPAVATRDDQGARVQVHASAGPRDAQAEAASILRIVRDAWLSEPRASIAVLVAKRSDATALTARLQAEGIVVRGIKLNALSDRAVVRDLLALTRALQHADDRTAWLALLRSPCCGLSLPELQILADQSGQAAQSMLYDEQRLAQLDDAARRRVLRVMQSLEPALRGAERNEALAQRVHRCWLRLGGAALCRDEAEFADARAFLAALDAFPDPGQLVGDACDQLAQDLYATAAAGGPCVDVLTMHAAKGLEWDVVIVPALGGRSRGAPTELLNAIRLTADDGVGDLLLAPIVAADAQDQLPLTHYIRGLNRQRGELERARQLYVTATRARRQLHWLGAAVRDRMGELQPPAGSLLRILWPAVQEDFVQQLGVGAGTAATTIAAPPAAAGVLRHRLPADWLASACELEIKRLPLPVHQPGESVEYSWVGQTARAIGTVVHAELQRYAQRRVPSDAASTWWTAARYREWLAQLGVTPAARAAAAEQVLQTLQATLRDARGRWLLTDSEHQQAWSERALTGLVDGRIINIVIDRMLIDRQGQRWIVDYKTSLHEGGDRELFVASELARYRPQLLRYAQLARGLGPEPVRCAIYFPVLGEWREVACQGTG